MQPIRIAVVVDSPAQPGWVTRVVEAVAKGGFAELAAVIVQRPAARRRQFLRAVYERVDSAWFARRDDAVSVQDLRNVVEPPLLLESNDPLPGAGSVDLILAFGAAAPPRLAEVAPLGVWTCVFDQWPAFVTRSPTTTCAIEMERLGTRSIVATTRAATDLISMRRGTSRLAAKAAALLLRSLEQIRPADPSQPHAMKGAPAVRGPVSIARIARAVTAAGGAYFLQAVRDRRAVEQWHVAFHFGEGQWSEDFASFHPIAPPKDRLWADPFVVSDGARSFIFVEELVYGEGRGVISVLEAFRDGSFSSPRRIIERPYHMSYPCVFRWDGEWYMVPETMENATIELYRAVEFPWRWEETAVLFRGVRAVDSTLFEMAGRWWMYTTMSADGKSFDDLSIYHADSPLGPWLPHSRNPVLSDVVGGRCAGRPFRQGDRILRAAQIGAPRYGHGMQLREIVRLTPKEWEESELKTIEPDWAPGLIGTHTLNFDGNVTVIDGARYRWR